MFGKKQTRNTDDVAFNVFVTRNYDQFITLVENRELDQKHIERLTESFKKKYLISPAVVNSKMQVIDGNHRMRVCRALGLPFYYTIQDGYGLDEMNQYNVLSKNWNSLDYLNFFYKRGLTTYVQFKDFMDKFPEFGISSCMRILSLLQNGRVQGKLNGVRVGNIRQFESGGFKIPDLQKSYSFANMLLDFKPFYNGYSRSTFVSAMMPIFDSKDYDHKTMLNKLSNQPNKLSHCNDIRQYRLLVEDIYNYKIRGIKANFHNL